MKFLSLQFKYLIINPKMLANQRITTNIDIDNFIKFINPQLAKENLKLIPREEIKALSIPILYFQENVCNLIDVNWNNLLGFKIKDDAFGDLIFVDKTVRISFIFRRDQDKITIDLTNFTIKTSHRRVWKTFINQSESDYLCALKHTESCVGSNQLNMQFFPHPLLAELNRKHKILAIKFGIKSLEYYLENSLIFEYEPCKNKLISRNYHMIDDISDIFYKREKLLVKFALENYIGYLICNDLINIIYSFVI